MSKNILIIDTYGLFFRYYYGVQPMINKNEININAVHGFMNGLLTIAKQISHDHLILALDSGSKGIRHEIYHEYKANRGKCPEDLVPQFDILDEILKSTNLHCIRKNKLEADDIINTIAIKATKNTHNTVIVSYDKDLMQLVSQNTQIYNPAKKFFINMKNIHQFIDIKPQQMSDYLALIGDKIDNIPGVKNIGPKAANELLKKYENIEEIYKNINKIANKRIQQLLIDGADLAILSKKLTNLIFDDEILLNFDNISNFDINNFSNDFEEILTQYGLDFFLKKILKIKSNKISNKPNIEHQLKLL